MRGYGGRGLLRDLSAGLVVAALAVPQGVAYALIAGLPPAMGLYAAGLPAVAAGLVRSSRYVVAGPSNALSLLVGGSVAALAVSEGTDPVSIAIALALWVGLVQLAAGVLRLGVAVGYISASVVLGYIAGAATLIVWGQLPNLAGNLEMAVGLGSALGMVLLGRIGRFFPAALVSIGSVTAIAWFAELPLATVADLAKVPAELPRLTIPFEMPIATHLALLPAAIAASVLSLVESTAVGRKLASASGERVDTNREIIGQGAANIAASFVGGYPVSGSLGRSVLNHSAGAQTRFAGIASGIFVLLAVVVGAPLVDAIPIASLAGMLLVLAWGLIDFRSIQRALRGSLGDSAALVVTFVGTWTLRLDHAIYLGVGVSIVLFLRRAQMLVVRELQVGTDGRLWEAKGRSCRVVRVLHAEGPLFFAAASELQNALDAALADEKLQVLLLRLKRTQGLDLSAAQVLEETAVRLAARGGRLLLVGLLPDPMALLARTGIAAVIGEENIFPTQAGWFVAMDQALAVAMAHDDHEGGCPLLAYLATRDGRPIPDGEVHRDDADAAQAEEEHKGSRADPARER
ncbi:MAG: SulP family inorganic anion transporter [Deltaproteobacteria bacterium]